MDPASTATEPVTVPIQADTRAFESALREASVSGRQFAAVLATAFDGLVVKGRGLDQVLHQLTASLSQMVLRAAFRPLEQGISQGLTSLLSGASGLASGGGVSKALPAPLARAGSAPSAVAQRVAASAPSSGGGSSQASAGGVAVTLNVTTPDAESFRRSESQIAAMLARAVALGQRNL